MDPVDLLERMVRVPSVSGAEGPHAELLVEAMSGLGFDAHVDEAGNAVGLRRGPERPGEPERELVLLGHQDTVPGTIPVRIEDGRLYGRGAVDAKGPLACFVQAVARVAPAPGTRLVVVGAVEEESASSKGARWVAPRHRPEACIIGEPSGWDGCTLGYKGRLLVDYRATQPGGHGAGPIGAVGERAFAFWQRVRAHCDELNAGRQRLFDQVLPSLRDVRTDSDGLTDEALLTLGLRLPPDFDREAFEARARALAEETGGAELGFRGFETAWTSPRTSPLARAFGRAIRASGGAARFKHKTGTSDMNVLGPVWRCPIVAYGPGDSLLDHTPDEHVEIAEYLRGIDVLASALVEAGYAVSAGT